MLIGRGVGAAPRPGFIDLRIGEGWWRELRMMLVLKKS
jgi:hypothetical protein